MFLLHYFSTCEAVDRQQRPLVGSFGLLVLLGLFLKFPRTAFFVNIFGSVSTPCSGGGQEPVEASTFQLPPWA